MNESYKAQVELEVLKKKLNKAQKYKEELQVLESRL